jgi:hypothetical protein
VFSIFREILLSLIVGCDYRDYHYFFAKAMIAISRLSQKKIFSQNNDYSDNLITVLFREKRLSFRAILSGKRKRNDYHYQPFSEGY